MAITRDSLLSLEAYAKARSGFRERVLAHKKTRTVHLGDHVTLIFEDELTVRYQIQEMLRIEKVFEEAGIQDELDAYNPLVPDGTNFKATMLIEYEDPAERMVALARLVGIEHRVWVQVEGCCASACDRRRGSAARDRDQDRRRAFPALRARRRRWRRHCEVARALPSASITLSTRRAFRLSLRRRARRSSPISPRRFSPVVRRRVASVGTSSAAPRDPMLRGRSSTRGTLPASRRDAAASPGALRTSRTSP